VDPALSADGVLTFQNAAVNAGVASPMASYVLNWSRTDNTTGQTTGQAVEQAGQATGSEVTARAPEAVLTGAAFVQVSVRTSHPDFPQWQSPVVLTFRREGAAWRHVGLERTVPAAGRAGASRESKVSGR
jgi:hypothetical protein